MLLNNTLFDVDTILNELKAEDKGRKPALEILQRKLKTHYFDKRKSNEEALNELENPAFNDFPRLKYVLQQVLSGQTTIKIAEALKDWEPSVTFEEINQKYGYFDKDLSELYKKLAIAGRKMTSLIERQAYDDEIAYKLMALFYDPNQTTEENFKLISQKFDNLITTKQDKPIATPYHDAFVTALHNFPRFSEVQAFERWKSFIIKNGFKSLDIFVQCAHHEAFASIEDAKSYLLQQKYPRANDNPALAQLCKQLLISNDGFEAGLKEVQTGWPKKESDNLPIVDIPDSTGRYFWVKLPPQDMRALYLGNLIPGCCQHIGGHSEQCVKDGIRLSDNGFYVLLKSKKATADCSRILDGQINDKDFDIVAQSYAWRTQNGNLCLDSIEWNPERVSTDNIQDLMRKFSTQVFEKHPEIKYLNVGVGGQTPEDIFPYAPIQETMKQGYLYGDARQQYQIECNMPKEALAALKERLKDVPQKVQNSLLYLAPYIQDIENVPGQLMDVIDELPENLSKIKLPPSLSTNDFKKISYEDYQQMNEAERASISTVCKVFNSQNEEELKQWLPTIPDEELVFIPLIKNKNSLEFKVTVLQRLPREHQLETLHELDASNQSILTQCLEKPELFKMILALYPTDESRLKALKNTLMRAISKPESLKMMLELLPERQRLEAIKEKDNDGRSILMHAVSSPESLKMILKLIPEMLSLEDIKEKDAFGCSILTRTASNPESFIIILKHLPENERLKAVKEKDNDGQSRLMRAASKTEDLKMMLELLPVNERLEAVKEKDNDGKSLLMRAASKTEDLKMMLELLPKNERLKAIKEKDVFGTSIFMHAASKTEDLKMMLELLPKNERLEAIKEKDNYNQSILMRAVYMPESLKMVLELLPERLTLEDIKEKDKNGKSLLMHAVSYPENLKILLELLPETQRLEAVTEKNNKGDSILRFAASNPKCLNIILEFLPKDISEVIQVCKKNLDPNDFEERTFSMLDFMTDMEGLATPEAINHFVHAVIDNQGIEQALNELFSPESSNSFFKSSSREAIQECVNNLDSHWLERIPKVYLSQKFS